MGTRSKISAEELKCPLCNEKLRHHENDPKFRIHLILHYSDELDHWANRLEKSKKETEKGPIISYKCNRCRRSATGGSENGAKSSLMFHMAYSHHEMRSILEKDSRIDKGMLICFFGKNLLQFSNCHFLFFYRFN